MAEAGVLPWWLGVVDRRGIPTRATLVVTAITGALVLLGDLTRVAALTDAAVLMSFLLVNLSLPWVVRRGLASPGVAVPQARFRAACPGAADVRLATRPYGVAQLGDGDRARARRAFNRERAPGPGRGCSGAGTCADRIPGLLRRESGGSACGATATRVRHRTRLQSRELRAKQEMGIPCNTTGLARSDHVYHCERSTTARLMTP